MEHILKTTAKGGFIMEMISKELKNITSYLRISGILETLPERISYAKVKNII